MKPTQALHELGQSLWIDDITRDMLDSGTLKKYIDDFSVTGLTSNPTIFDNAISKSDSYDPEIRRLMKAGFTGEALFFELALQDLSRAADLFLPIHERTATVDGFGLLEVSPLLAYDTQATVAEAKRSTRGRTAEPVHQDPRHERGPAGHRGGDLLRRHRQRDAAVLGGRLATPPPTPTWRAGTAGRGRPRSGHPLRGLHLHQPLGQGGDGQGARRPARQARHRRRSSGLQRLSRDAR